MGVVCEELRNQGRDSSGKITPSWGLATLVKTEQRKVAKQLATQQALLQEQQQDMAVQPDAPGIER